MSFADINSITTVNQTNIAEWKKECDALLNSGQTVDAKILNKIALQSKSAAKTIQGSDRAWLDSVQTRVGEYALRLGHSAYQSGDYTNAKAYYKIADIRLAKTHQTQLSDVHLNLADISKKSNLPSGVSMEVCNAIKLNPSNSKISSFIDSSMSILSYTSLDRIAHQYESGKQFSLAAKYYQAAMNKAEKPEYQQIARQNMERAQRGQ